MRRALKTTQTYAIWPRETLMRPLDSSLKASKRRPPCFAPKGKRIFGKIFSPADTEVRNRNNRETRQMRRHGLRIEAQPMRLVKKPLTKKS